MRRSIVGIILVLALGCLVAPRRAEAQQPVKVHRIGVLMFTSSPFFIEELRQGLRELGYVEGRNLTLEVRSAEGRRERLADLAAELVRLPVDLIVAHTTARGAGSQARHHDAPDCCGGHDRPGRGGDRGKPGAPGREHHGIVPL